MKYEYTDTFGGESNYSWVQRGEVMTDDFKKALRLAKKELGLSGVRGRVTRHCGDMIAWVPYRMATILFIIEKEQ